MTETPSLTELADRLRETCSRLSVLAAALNKRRQSAPVETARSSAARIREVAQTLEARGPED